MSLYTVIGTDRQTGQRVKRVFHATNERNARELATQDGMDVQALHSGLTPHAVWFAHNPGGGTFVVAMFCYMASLFLAVGSVLWRSPDAIGVIAVVAFIGFVFHLISRAIEKRSNRTRNTT